MDGKTKRFFQQNERRVPSRSNSDISSKLSTIAAFCWRDIISRELLESSSNQYASL